jgi:hypothetical protein
MTWQAGLAVVAATLAVGGGAEPVQIAGEPLRSSGGLRLLVADEPPFVLDVDSGSVTRVRGVSGDASVVEVGGRSGAVLAGDIAYAVDRRTARARRLGPALAAVPATDGRSVWLKSRTGRGCALRRVRLDGTAVGAARAFPCSWTIQPGGGLGIVARRTQVLDPRTGRTVFRARWGIIAAAGDKLVLAGPNRRLKLVFTKSGSDIELRWPSVLDGLDAPAVDPRGRYLALGFADPAWADEHGNTVGQVIDVWLLDIRTGALTQVPGLPAFAGLKGTSMEWTADGRLVVLGEDERRSFVALWRPGAAALSVKTLRLPRRSGYSDSFAPLR